MATFMRKSCLVKTWKIVSSSLVRGQIPAANLVTQQKQFTTTGRNNLKEIKLTTEGDLTTVEGVSVESPNRTKLVDLPNDNKLCPVCPYKLGVDIKYTDVLILSQFLRSDGCLLPRRVTKVCAKGQSNLEKLVHQAQRAGLMPEFRPDLRDGRQRTSLKSRHKWRKYNIYYGDD